MSWYGKRYQHQLAANGIKTANLTKSGKYIKFIDKNEFNSYNYWYKIIKDMIEKKILFNQYDIKEFLFQLKNKNQISNTNFKNLYEDTSSIIRYEKRNNIKRKYKRNIYSHMTPSEYIDFIKHDKNSLFYEGE